MTKCEVFRKQLCLFCCLYGKLMLLGLWLEVSHKTKLLEALEGRR